MTYIIPRTLQYSIKDVSEKSLAIGHSFIYLVSPTQLQDTAFFLFTAGKCPYSPALQWSKTEELKWRLIRSSKEVQWTLINHVTVHWLQVTARNGCKKFWLEVAIHGHWTNQTDAVGWLKFNSAEQLGGTQVYSYWNRLKILTESVQHTGVNKLFELVL